MADQDSSDRGPKRARAPLAESERRTLIFSNVPVDATDRELRNFFAFAEGFVKAQKQPNKPSNVFALFDTQASALAALEILRDYTFEEGGDRLKSSLAQGNMSAPGHRARMPSDTFGSLRAQQQMQNQQQQHSMLYSALQPMAPNLGMGGLQDLTGGYSSYLSGLNPPPLQGFPSGLDYSPSTRSGGFGSGGGGGGGGRISSGSYNDVQNKGKDNPPCDTIFLRGLTAPEQTIKENAIALGYIDMKIMKNVNNMATSAFVQFPSAEHAAAALPVLAGSVCSNVEYSKNPLNRKRNRDE